MIESIDRPKHLHTHVHLCINIDMYVYNITDSTHVYVWIEIHYQIITAIIDVMSLMNISTCTYTIIYSYILWLYKKSKLRLCVKAVKAVKVFNACMSICTNPSTCVHIMYLGLTYILNQDSFYTVFIQ